MESEEDSIDLTLYEDENSADNATQTFEDVSKTSGNVLGNFWETISGREELVSGRANRRQIFAFSADFEGFYNVPKTTGKVINVPNISGYIVGNVWRYNKPVSRQFRAAELVFLVGQVGDDFPGFEVDPGFNNVPSNADNVTQTSDNVTNTSGTILDNVWSHFRVSFGAFFDDFRTRRTRI